MTRHDVPVGIHTHNDSELGVANALGAVRAGATMVQGTLNGVGERCGNCNLVSIVPALKLKMGVDCVTDEQLAHLRHTARGFDELTNRIPWAANRSMWVVSICDSGLKQPTSP